MEQLWGRRSAQVGPYKELPAQISNNLTLLEILDNDTVVAVNDSDSYIFTCSARCDIKCWSKRTAKLQKSTRASVHQLKKLKVDLQVNNNFAILATLAGENAQIFIWDYLKREDIKLLTPTLRKRKIISTLLSPDNKLIVATKSEVFIYDIEDNGALSEILIITDKPTTFISHSLGYLYIATNKTLSAYSLADDARREVTVLEDKILALFEIEWSSSSIVLTGHTNHCAKLWTKDLANLATLNLLPATAPYSKQRYESRNQAVTYSVKYVSERKELVISHNEHFSVYNLFTKQLVHLESNAHRSEITGISLYRTDSSAQLLTMCCSCIRLWRYSMSRVEATARGEATTRVEATARGEATTRFELLGEIIVSNVERMVAEADVGLYLGGRCYETGLVLWRDSEKYLARQLQNSRRFIDS